ncbi:MAG: hypothetical protein K2P60_10635 [Lachnospiraceae bacterium]|nr:hypothetical protein [Lachnospiraceae bacterium]
MEPNDSPFTAVSVDTGAIITGYNLNVSNDKYLFAWNVPSTVNDVSLSLDNSDYTLTFVPTGTKVSTSKMTFIHYYHIDGIVFKCGNVS